MTNKSNYVSINGIKIHYERSGEGLPIVFVHAGIADSRMWDDQVGPLAKGFQVITYDMRGFGLSPQISGQYSHYKDLISLLDELEIERCVLVGSSKGGSVSLDAVLSSPERIAGLIVAGGMAHGLELQDEPPPPPQWEEASKALKAGDLMKTNELEVQMWVDGYKQPIGRADESIRNKVMAMNAIVLENESNASDAVEKVLKPEAGVRLDELRLPTLFIKGDLDDPYIHQAIDKMTDEIPNARQETIHHAAHLPNMEKPDIFNELVVNFLNDNSLADTK